MLDDAVFVYASGVIAKSVIDSPDRAVYLMSASRCSRCFRSMAAFDNFGIEVVCKTAALYSVAVVAMPLFGMFFAG